MTVGGWQLAETMSEEDVDALALFLELIIGGLFDGADANGTGTGAEGLANGVWIIGDEAYGSPTTQPVTGDWHVSDGERTEAVVAPDPTKAGESQAIPGVVDPFAGEEEEISEAQARLFALASSIESFDIDDGASTDQIVERAHAFADFLLGL